MADNALDFPAQQTPDTSADDDRTLLHLLQEEAARRQEAGEELAPIEDAALNLPVWEDGNPQAVVRRLAFMLDMAHVPPADSLERRFDDMARRYAANVATRNHQVTALSAAIGDALYLIQGPGHVKRAAKVLLAAIQPQGS